MSSEIHVACCDITWKQALALRWRAQRRVIALSTVGAGVLAGLGALWYATPSQAVVIALLASLLILLWSAVVIAIHLRRGARFSREQQPRWTVGQEALTWHVANGTATSVPWHLVSVRPGQWGYHLTFNGRGEHVMAFRSFTLPEQRATFESMAIDAGSLRA